MITISGITPTSTHLSGNEIKVTATTSGAPTGATGYQILLKIVSADNVIKGGPFIDAKTPDENGEVKFDPSGYVNQPYEVDFKWPIPNQWESRWQGYVDQVYDVMLVPGERYINEEGELVENFQASWGTIFVVKGQLNYLVLAQLNDLGKTWHEYYCVEGRWLTYMPLVQTVGPYQPVKLWWKPPTTSLGLTLKGKAYYSDGKTIDFSTSGADQLWYDVMFEFSVQPVGLEFYPIVDGAQLLYYEVWLQTTPGVEKRTFIVEHAYKESNYYLFADNQIGGIDTIWLSGAAKYAPTGERTVSSKPFEPGMGVKQRTRFVNGESRRRRWIINSGFKSKEEMEALDVLLDTPHAWLAVPPPGGSNEINDYKIVPVIITSSELALTDSMNDLESVDIEMEEAY